MVGARFRASAYFRRRITRLHSNTMGRYDDYVSFLLIISMMRSIRDIGYIDGENALHSHGRSAASRRHGYSRPCRLARKPGMGLRRAITIWSFRGTSSRLALPELGGFSSFSLPLFHRF